MLQLHNIKRGKDYIHQMQVFLEGEQLAQYYTLVNRVQNQATDLVTNNGNPRIDLFVVLDISGSMNFTSNSIMNFGWGFTAVIGRLLAGGVFRMDEARVRSIFATKLDEAKLHLV